ncbi:TRAP transporter large permease [Neptunomonas japonica]|uniref:TRAP transporter large permease protein n=1 Tax=Neptunomonas japonica JAMM 1380 TaxID=1441457 RepID=A0A7R6SU48_9GAMM|nr:TRAP transporter large permease [Neptunomonas japonica]BBB28109.1 TRAP dicarboxylate transporter DctP subunit [Neptunomonas japonica JAMM 1380]
MYNYLNPEVTLDWGWELGGPLLIGVIMFALGVPVWAVLGVISVLILELSGALPLSLLGEALFDGIDAFALIAIPLFILTGDVLVRTGLSRKLLDIAEALTGGAKSGFGTATVLVCGFFACISGSDAAGAAGVGRMTIDRLVEQGYPRPYACALVAAGACTGILIPPSIAYIIIGLVLGISASTLFLAALVPGLLVMGCIMVCNIILNLTHGFENAGGGFSLRRIITAIYVGRYALIVPVIILGGIYSGVFTPTEAAAIAVITTIIIGLWQKTISLSEFPAMLASSAKVNGVILPIIAFSLPLAQALAALEVPQGFVYMVTDITDDPTMIILLMISILILAGCVMETTPNIVILAPIMLPLAQEIGMADIQFCIMMITALGVGFITPPLGLNLFVVSGLTGTPILGIARNAVPFVLAMLSVVLLLAFVPELSLWALPSYSY